MSARHSGKLFRGGAEYDDRYRAKLRPVSGGGRHRAMVIEAEVDDLGNMLRRAKVRGFEIMCDEPESIGGNGTAPAPLHYFAASILF